MIIVSTAVNYNGIRKESLTYPYDEQQPPYPLLGSQVAPPKSDPHRPSLLGAVVESEARSTIDEGATPVQPEEHPWPQ